MIRALFVSALVTLTAACGAPSSTSTSATVAHPNKQANVFTCTSDGGLTFVYSSTSFTGQPTVQITRDATEARTPLVQLQGHGIKVVKQGSSSLVSVSKLIPDLETRTWSLAVPETILPPHTDAAPFASVINETVVPTSIAGPLPGQKPTTTAHQATCQARFAIY